MTEIQDGNNVKNNVKYHVGDVVKTRKPHACGGNVWQVVRAGADYKLKCATCGRVVSVDNQKFRKIVKM